MGKRRKKTRTHVVEPDTAPKSFVIGKGQSIDALVVDFRKSMEPNTASKLRQRRSNKVKDFIHVAAQLQVTHLVHFSESRTGVNLRIAKIPRGPTLTFHVKSFSLCKDILALQKRPIHLDFFTAPLLVLNNFDQESNHAKLLTATLQNMYPTIKVNTMLLSNVRRVVLYNWNTETQLIEFRQYAITVKQTGLSKSIKTIIQSKVPNLGKFQDVSDYVLSAAFASESDMEDGPDTLVQVQTEKAKGKRAIKLTELGPRLSLQLLKIEDDCMSGEIIHHAYISKTREEIEQLKQRKEREKLEREQRKQQQEANVASKKAAQELKDKKADKILHKRKAESDAESEDEMGMSEPEDESENEMGTSETEELIEMPDEDEHDQEDEVEHDQEDEDEYDQEVEHGDREIDQKGNPKNKRQSQELDHKGNLKKLKDNPKKLKDNKKLKARY